MGSEQEEQARIESESVEKAHPVSLENSITKLEPIGKQDVRKCSCKGMSEGTKF